MDNEKDSNEDTKTTVLSSQPLADRQYIHDYFRPLADTKNFNFQVVHEKAVAEAYFYAIFAKIKVSKPLLHVIIFFSGCSFTTNT